LQQVTAAEVAYMIGFGNQLEIMKPVAGKQGVWKAL